MLKIGVIIMALSATLLGNWFSNLFDPTPTPTIHIPVDLTKTGTLVDTEFRVNYKESTYFALDFECKDVKLDGGKDCKEKRKFLGLNGYLYGDGKQITKADYDYAKHVFGESLDKSYDLDGTLIPLHITLDKIEENGKLTNILDKTYETKGWNGGGSNGEGNIYRYITYRDITRIGLEKGKYKLIVKNLQAFEELNGRPVKFKIKSTYRK